MQRYNPKDIETKWQKRWEDDAIYVASENPDKPKKYVLEYFPYPSGAAMHVGHVRNYTIGDAVARHARMKGFNVLHPMGWDAFGLPAENYAIKNNISPQQAIAENTAKFKRQLMQMGFSYDWTREINSSDPKYYKWTQWFFELLLERGLAYQKDSLQWWCDFDKTVLANEQVEAGKCWRCGNPVSKKALKQWFFKITDYADRLVEDLDKLDWSDAIKSMQRNWIGKSKGAEIDFNVDGDDSVKIKVFTTRPDTLFGATFMVLAPEHELVAKITSDKHREAVEHYKAKAAAKSDVERQEVNREKTGVFTGAYAVNPANGSKIPVWIADYVLTGYGTGAIMAVPAHDDRDAEFAQKFELPIVPVIAPSVGKYLVVENSISPEAGKQLSEFGDVSVESVSEKWGKMWRISVQSSKEQEFRYFLEKALLATNWYSDSMGTTNWVVFKGQSILVNSSDDYDKFLEIGKSLGIPTEQLDIAKPASWHDEGVMVNSGEYDGQKSQDVRTKIVEDLAAKHVGQAVVNYKIRDWLISRQRYWGAPIPIIHCEEHGAVPVPKDQLPVVLPEVSSYQPNGEGTSVLAGVEEWVNVPCPTCGKPAKRETDTMDGFACSSWYFLRFADPHNDELPFADDKVKFWLPVDDYIGGAEHAVMHLLYARMWTKVMHDAGMIDFDEPFLALRNQGMILAPDGRKMSKSWGNTITPDEIIDQGYGADAIRVMELFIGPWDQMANWSVEGMGGCYRFLNRIWTLVQECNAEKLHGADPYADDDLLRLTHKAIKKVSDDLESMSFNTAVAAMMEMVNELYKVKAEWGMESVQWVYALSTLAQLLAPFAPHIAEELWHQLGHETSVHLSPWPEYDEKYLVTDTLTVAIQVNGKLRGEVTVNADAGEDEIVAAAQANEKVASHLEGKEIRKTIYVPGKLVNFVAS